MTALLPRIWSAPSAVTSRLLEMVAVQAAPCMLRCFTSHATTACSSAATQLEPSTSTSSTSTSARYVVPDHGYFWELKPAGYGNAWQQGNEEDVSIAVFNWARERVSNMALLGSVFNVPIRRDILHRVVVWQRAKRRQGSAAKKGRAEVSGGGRKPRPQKGSGQSRQGSIRAPQWRGGGLVFAPKPRDWEHKLNRRIRRMGLKCALSAKTWENRIVVVDTLALEHGKTKELQGLLETLLPDAPRTSFLLMDCGPSSADGGEMLRRAASNLPDVDILPVEGANVYSILLRDYLVVTVDAVNALTARVLAPIKR